jgi:sugar phosphate isomerase/epimerase
MVPRPFPFRCLLVICIWFTGAFLGGLASAQDIGTTPDVFRQENLVAWCIVPFDAKKRGPEERAAMLEKLGIQRFAYDYRAEHVPTWDAELEALQKHGIELTAWWFPTKLNDEAKQTLALFQRHGVKPQLWINGGGAPTKDTAEQAARIETEAQRVRPIAEAAAPLGLKLALYNHGGWWGEPENQIAIIERLQRDGITNVGIVYNLHHGHAHLDRFAELLAKIKPHLLTLNLNGMSRGADQAGDKIMPLGQGELDLELLRTIRASGWNGRVGILNHTSEDAEARLLDNLDGLRWLVAKLDGKDAGAKPVPRSWRLPKAPIPVPAKN